MPCLCRMNEISLLGLIWLYIYSTGLYVASLEPGYLDFDNLPDTNFSCVGKVIGGYYADLEANCQMFHVCTIGQLDEPMDIRFLCLNGTVFDQETRVCERIDEVDCSKSEKFYSLNLELYGNTQPPILEDDGDTESPPIEKSTYPTTTTTTTTTTPRPRSTTTTRPPQFFSSSIRTVIPSSHHKIPPSHHFPIGEQHNSPHYTPEEINISLNPGAPPDIRTKPSQFPTRSYSDSVNSDNEKNVVTTDSSVFDSASENANIKNVANRLHFSSTTERSSINYNNIQTQQPQNNFNFNFNYHDADTQDFSSPRPHNYHYQNNLASFRPPGLSGHSYSDNPFRSSTHRNEYLPVTRKTFEINRPTPTARSFFLQPIKSPSHQYFTRTEKPQGDDLPVPVLPTLSPIVFSSPAPFTLSRHKETKRFTDGHESPPRIIISASASVSDASGRTLNYSLGTIGAAQLLAQPPTSYDDYKEDDVVLDPFFHDVPKIQNKQKRSKRDTDSRKVTSSKLLRTKRVPQNINPSDIIKSEDEAIEVLKFLFDWYKNHEKTTKPPINIPVSPDEITNINKEFSRSTYNTEDYSDDTTLERGITSHESGVQNSELFNSKSKYNILGNLFDTSISRRPGIQEPVTKPYRSSNNEDILSDTVGRPSTTYKQNYEVTKTPEIIEQPNSKHAKNEYLPNATVAPSNSKRKAFRGRHRFTFPYSSTERHRTALDDEEPYIQRTTSNPSKQHIFNSGLEYAITDSYELKPIRRYQNTYEPNETWNQRNTGGENTSVEGNQDFIYPVPNTESFSTNILKDKQIGTNQDLVSHETIERNKSSIVVNYGGTSSIEKHHTENYKEQEKSVETFHNISTEAPAYKIGDAIDAAIKTQSNSENISNTSVHDAGVNSEFYNDKSNESYDQDLSLEELNREETQKATNHIQQTSTQNYGSFDIYDYVNDNYEPTTYSENTEKLVEQQLENGNKEFVNQIVHEETHIDVDFTEPSQDITSEQDTKSTSVMESTSSDSSRNKLKESSKSFQETSTNEGDDRDLGDANTPTYKFVDKNINSFSDILKSLRDFQRYEQNVYDYKHNLIGLKEYVTPQEDNETLTTTIPTTLESNTNKLGTYNEIKNETVNRDNEGMKFNSSYTFTNLHRENYEINKSEEQYTDSTKYINSITQSEQNHIFSTQVPEEEQQLYTSKPVEDVNVLKTNTLIIFDHSESTKTLSYAPTETTISNIEGETILPVEPTTISNLEGETILPVEPTTIRNKIDEIPSDEITTLNLRTEHPLTEVTNLKIKSEARPRTRQRNRANSRHRIHNQPYSNYKLSNSEVKTEQRRKSRRRQQNKPHLSESVSTTTSKTTFTPKSTEFYATTEQNKLYKAGVPDLQYDEDVKSETQKKNNILLLNVTESSESTLPQNGIPTEPSNNKPTGSTINENAFSAFFITKTPKYTINENNIIGANLIKTTPSALITQKISEIYTDNLNMDEDSRQTDTPTTLSSKEDSTNPTPTYVFIIKTTENTPINEDNTSELPLSADTTMTTSFAENEPLITTPSSFESLLSDNETPTFSTELPTTSQDTTTTTTKDLFETLFTDFDTTTDVADSTEHKEERHVEKYPTIINASHIRKFDSENMLIKEIEEATNSTVVSELAQIISAEGDISVNTTEESTLGDNNKEDIVTLENAETPTTVLELTTESFSTSYNKPNIISTHQADHQTTSEKYEYYSTAFITTTKNIEENTRSTLDSTTIFPSTKIEVITQINTDTVTGVSNGTEGTFQSQYSYNNELSAINHKEKDSENKIKKYSSPRTQERLSKKKSPGRRRFSLRHRFSSNNVTPKSARSRIPFQKSYEINRFDAELATPIPAGTTEQIHDEKLKQNLHKYEDEASMTDDPLPKNVKPTQGDSVVKIDLNTTPLSTLYKVQLRKERVNKQFIFNCFGKPLDAFYSDPRDCRLFHYCTKGYTRNQLLDMKFVCDFGTHFDDEKLVCTTEIPKRCL